MTAPDRGRPTDKSIVFDSDRAGGADIYVMRSNGSGVRRLTTGGTTDPAWAPDGSTIAFTSNRDGNDEIYVMKPDGERADEHHEQLLRPMTRQLVAGRPFDRLHE